MEAGKTFTGLFRICYGTFISTFGHENMAVFIVQINSVLSAV